MQRRTQITKNNILLDTDVISFIFKNREQAKFFLTYLQGRTLFISFITLAELYHGVYKNRWSENRVTYLKNFLLDYAVLPFDDGLCLQWANIKTSCEANGHPIEDSDCRIAACAIYYDCTLATNNSRHFLNVKNIELLSPAFN